jgi:hypothetical protein
MSTNEIATQGAYAASAPSPQMRRPSSRLRRRARRSGFERGQTVCNEKNDKGKLHNGHLKQVSPIREEARQHMRGDDLLYRCQTCGTLYMGPPLGHVRDPRKQARYVQSELVDILEAAGGTLPAFKQNETGAWVPSGETATPQHAPAPVAAAAQNVKPAAPVKPLPSSAPATTAAASSDETPEQNARASSPRPKPKPPRASPVAVAQRPRPRHRPRRPPRHLRPPRQATRPTARPPKRNARA